MCGLNAVYNQMYLPNRYPEGIYWAALTMKLILLIHCWAGCEPKLSLLFALATIVSFVRVIYFNTFPDDTGMHDFTLASSSVISPSQSHHPRHSSFLFYFFILLFHFSIDMYMPACNNSTPPVSPWVDGAGTVALISRRVGAAEAVACHLNRSIWRSAVGISPVHSGQEKLATSPVLILTRSL